MNLDMAMFQQTFFEETVDILAELETLLLRLESTPDDPELLNTIFRCAHSIKGGSATFGFADIAHFTHSLETLLDQLRNGRAQVDKGITQLLLESLDQLKALLAVARGEAGSAPDSAPLILQIEEAIACSGYQEEAWDEDALRAEIAQILAAQEAESKSAQNNAGSAQNAAPRQNVAAETGQAAARAGERAGLRRYHLHFTPGADVMRQGADPALLMLALADCCETLDIRCDVSRLPALKECDPETCYLSWDADFRSDREPQRLLDIFEFVRDSSRVVLEEITVPSISAAPDSAAQAAPAPVPLTPTPAPAPEPSIVTAAPMGGAQSAPPVTVMSTPEMQNAPPAASSSAQAQSRLPESKPTPAPANTAGKAASVGGANKADAQTLRVATDKIDKLINLVGELIINQSMLNEVMQDFSMAKVPRLREAVAEMERASRELQERVMAVRMLPIKHAFGRFPRLVHDLATACSKQIELKTNGEETELDKSVIEAIADPLTHLVRNSVDHGLETPAERREAGKTETGTVMLNAFHEGGSIVIEISDDGRGLNRDRILRKAIERGLLSESDPVPPDEALYNYIFHPGFSTAPQVTDLSGRGVGMDIVKQSIRALGGSISLLSTPGQGTRFRIRLPLTLAILEGLSLSVGEEVYILPLTSIVESIRPRPGDVRLVAGKTEVVVVRGEVLPLVRLYQIFGTAHSITDPARGLLVMVENEGHKIALLVDELIGQSQVVIKSLETNYGKVDGLAGATILGDGHVALIVDVPALVRTTATTQAQYMAA